MIYYTLIYIIMFCFNLLIFINLFSIINSNCPSNFNYCQTSYINNSFGTDVININWDPSAFTLNNVWIKLVTTEGEPNKNNCYYNYKNIIIDSTNTDIFFIFYYITTI